jgi:hypothetical protein
VELRRKRATFGGNEKETESLDFEREFLRSKEFFIGGRFREAIQSCIKAIWLFYNHKGEIHYRKNITNREYLVLLRQYRDSAALEEIIMRAELAIYGDEGITRETCENIHNTVSEIISR